MVDAIHSDLSKDEETRRKAEVARRNVRGKIGIIADDIKPIGFFKVNGDEKLENMHYISENKILFTG
jgi:hypothetical protein